MEGLKAREIQDLLSVMTPEERAEVLTLARVDNALWRPQPGPQAEAYASEADIVGYGGSAGGGKTDLMLGKVLTRHRRGIIFRREATQLQGIYDRLAEILQDAGGREGFNSQEKIWRPPSIPHLQLEFGSVPNPEDVGKYQGRPHDFIGFDEVTNFLEAQVRFLMGWLRTAILGQRCQALMTFNPPTTAEGQWVIAFFAPWLDDMHPNPAKPGELRWYASIEGKDVERPDGEPFLHNGEEVQPLSRTFIPARVQDNPRLMATGYMATLQSLPEPLRSQMLYGDFKAGREDDAFQVIPTAWVDAAMARWEPRLNKGPMDGMGVDVARGGRDKTIICRRHGTWFDELAAFPGAVTPDGPTTAALVISYRRDKAPVHVDVVGWGAAVYDFLCSNGIQTEAINGSNKSFGFSKDGSLKFTNHRAELWWRLREALDPTNPDPICLPKDPELRADLCAPRWDLKTNGIQIEGKQELIKRIGRSPDKGDALAYGLINTLKDDFDRNASDRERAARRGPQSWMS